MSMADIVPRKLWEHEAPETTQLYRFWKNVESRHGVRFHSYSELHEWSIQHLSLCWEDIWDFTGIRASRKYTEVVKDDAPLWPRPVWFEGALLNYAENLLCPASNPDPQSIAVVAATEFGRRSTTWHELRERVRLTASALRNFGVKSNHVVGLIGGNTLESLVLLLATSAIGATICASSPDLGVTAVLERLQQVDPVILFADNGVIYNGKKHSSMEKLKIITPQLPTVKNVVLVPSIEGIPAVPQDLQLTNGSSISLRDFLSRCDDSPEVFEQLPFDHPLIVLYSSGTTSKAKVIVHGQGTLIQHKKEHQIHGDIGPGDVFLQITQINWMMWPWLVTGLASGATIVLYDGSPFMPAEQGGYAMWKLSDELGVKAFGTSAKYLSTLEQNDVLPRERYSLAKLRSIYSTGSVLPPSTFEYIYKAFPPQVAIQSITGGTDIISLFAAPNPLLSIHVGECQGKGLAMAVRVYNEAGEDVEDAGLPGDLVCSRPFPCAPVAFWGGDEGKKKYRQAYFDKFDNVWHHGDFCRVNPKTGGITMLGRSDGILNPSGVRFGSAEIYTIITRYFPAEIEDSLCVGRRRPTDDDETVVLFVKMAEGHVFSDDLVKAIKAKIRTELSPRHVPGIIDETKAIPQTINQKKIETVVKQIISGSTLAPAASVGNPESLAFYKEWAARH